MFLFALVQATVTEHRGGEANLILPDLNQATFLNGITGSRLLSGGLVVAALGLQQQFVEVWLVTGMHGHTPYGCSCHSIAIPPR